MTRDQASLMMPFMVAYIGGADIQVYADNEWRDCEPYFNPNVMYRIKPKERRIWVNIYRDRYGVAYDTKLGCDASCANAVLEKAVEFVEVINE